MEILTIDSCEYLYGGWGNATVLTHKGNCVYCIDRLKKCVEEAQNGAENE